MLASIYDPGNKAEQVLTVGDSASFATAAQGALADTAVQPAGIADFETTTQLNTRDTNNRARANHTGTQTASTISDFQSTVSANTDVAANTAARHDAATVLDSTSIDLIISGQQISAQREALTGDVTAPKNSNTTTIANNAVTNAKAAQMPANTIKGNNTGSTANASDLTPAQVRTLINVADGANNYVHPNHTGDVTSTGDGATVIANNAVSNAKFRQSAGFSVVGKTDTGTGNVADITAGTDGVLRRSGSGNLAFGTIVTGNINDDAVTYAKLQNVAANSVLARSAGTSGDVGEVALAASQLLGRGASGDVAPITLGTNLTMSGTTLNASGGGGGTNINTIYIDQAGGTSDTYGVLAGARNGSNKVFTVSQGAYATGTLKVYRNGQLMTQGTGEDFVETAPTSGTFTFDVAPASTDEITVEYQVVTTTQLTTPITRGQVVAIANNIIYV